MGFKMVPYASPVSTQDILDLFSSLASELGSYLVFIVEKSVVSVGLNFMMHVLVEGSLASCCIPRPT